jgi:hypothetical protein
MSKSPHQVEHISDVLYRVKVPKNNVEHSRYQFKLIANCHKSLSLLSVKHEIADQFDSYYYELQTGYMPLSKSRMSDANSNYLILNSIFEILIEHTNHYLYASNLVYHPDYIFINEQNELKFMYVPIKDETYYSNIEIIRIILLMLSGLKVEFNPSLFSSLLNIYCEEYEVFKKAKIMVCEHIDRNRIFASQPLETKKGLLARIREIMFGLKNQDSLHSTTLISSPMKSSKHLSAKFINENLDAHYILKSDVILGRDNGCDIQINQPQISRKHLAIHEINNVVQISDLNSSNGTFLNGERLKPNYWYTLKERDALEIGNYKLWYERIS